MNTIEYIYLGSQSEQSVQYTRHIAALVQINSGEEEGGVNAIGFAAVQKFLNIFHLQNEKNIKRGLFQSSDRRGRSIRDCELGHHQPCEGDLSDSNVTESASKLSESNPNQ